MYYQIGTIRYHRLPQILRPPPHQRYLVPPLHWVRYWASSLSTYVGIEWNCFRPLTSLITQQDHNTYQIRSCNSIRVYSCFFLIYVVTMHIHTYIHRLTIDLVFIYLVLGQVFFLFYNNNNFGWTLPQLINRVWIHLNIDQSEARRGERRKRIL